MKTSLVAPDSIEPTEAEIRDYAYHLYEQAGRQPGHELDHWLEAAACLRAHIPPHRSHLRLHRHLHPDRDELEREQLCAMAPEARNLAS